MIGNRGLAIALGGFPVFVVLILAALIPAAPTASVPESETTIATSASTTTTAASSSPPSTSSSSGGTSTVSITAVSSTGTPLDRKGYNMYMQLFQDGSIIASCYAPCSFTVHNGQTYQVNPNDWGPEIFSHWQNDGSIDRETVHVPSYSTTISLVAVYNP